MAEKINNNVFADTKKFVDLTGLDYFWDKAKAYIDGIDTTIKASVKDVTDRTTVLETTVGNKDAGLVKVVNTLREEVNALGGANGGSISDMINGKINDLGTAGVAEGDDFVKSVSVVNGKLQVTSGKCKDWSGDISAAEGRAKSYADGLASNYDAAGSAAAAQSAAEAKAAELANAAEAAAKKHADDLASNYDAAGSAAAAEAAAKKHADDLNTAMDTRVKVLEEIDHQGIVDNAINDFATKVSNDNVVNTYKELIDYAAAHGSEFTELVGVVSGKADKTYVDGLDEAMDNRVKVLEEIDHDAYINADVVLKGQMETYADGKASDAQSAAEGYADGVAATAKSEAITEAGTLASGAETRAKAYTDEREIEIDKKWAAADVTVLSSANSHADSVAATAKSEAIIEAGTLASGAETRAKAHADSVAATAKSEAIIEAGTLASNAQAAAIAQAKKDAADALKSYYTKSEIDTKLGENSKGDRAYAKQYTDELFGSFHFAESGDIDALFA